MPGPRNLWKVSLRLVICALLLVWIFHAIFVNEARLATGEEAWLALSRTEQWQNAWSLGPKALWDTLRQVHPGAFAISLIFMGGTLLMGMLRWRLALRVQGLNLSLGRATEISLVAHFFNSFVLGSTGGDLMKAYYAARETHHLKTEAVVTVFVDRLIGLFSMLIFACVMALPNLTLALESKSLITFSTMILGMMVACAIIVRLAFWSSSAEGSESRWRLWLRRLPKGEVLEKSLISCRSFGSAPGFMGKSLGYSMVLNGLCVLQFYSLSKGLDLDVPLQVYFFVVPAIICISALPITPGGLGIRENLYVLVLAAGSLAVEETKALSLSLLAYGGSLCWSLVGGLVYVTLKESHHLEEIR